MMAYAYRKNQIQAWDAEVQREKAEAEARKNKPKK